MKKINKKGAIDDFGSVIVAGGIMLFIIIAMFFFVGLMKTGYEKRPDLIEMLDEASYTTRTVLQWETKTGMTLHESLVKHNSKEMVVEVYGTPEIKEGFFKDLYEVLEEKGLLGYRDWFVVITSTKIKEIDCENNREDINEHYIFCSKHHDAVLILDTMHRERKNRRADEVPNQFNLVTFDLVARNSFINFNRVTIPDGDGGIIEIAIKQIKQPDLTLYTRLNELYK